uniref:RecF/RecN/SMC N-terminal domain-containing protein n=1 Tax=Romanomermis culicivorax TaxID=13658 RepID=A0A915KFY6_ROMCU
MDEIDAALDFKNVSIVANYIKERTKNAQFIVISLRNNMFELCDRLVGIYKTYNCTKSVTFDPEKVALKPAANKTQDDQGLARKLNVDPPIAEKTATENDLQVSPVKRQRIVEN